MAYVIVAGVLGVITICGGLFLRRLLSEVAELRRQITWVERQMRAQRARVTFLRYLVSQDEEDDGDGDGMPDQAVVNGHSPGAAPWAQDGPPPVLQKKHLGLHLGGLVAAALVTVSTAAREAARAHRGQLVGAIAGTTITAATVTMVTVQPWNAGSSKPPSSAPTASVAPSYWPPGSYPPPRRPSSPPSTGAPTSPSPTPTTASPTPSPSPSPPSQSPSPATSGSAVPIGAEMPAAPRPAPAPAQDSGASDTPSAPDTPPDTAEPDTPSAPPASSPPPSQTADSALCVVVPAVPALNVAVCALGG